MKPKSKKKTAITLQGNLHIRAEAPHKAKKRMENALAHNQLLAAQQAAQYKLELQRLDAAAARHPVPLQGSHVTARGAIQHKVHTLKFA